ncbi:MAG: hypothetical protein ACFCUM_04580 [Bacteroidales bacterium]|jgi:hypothetical protein
MPYRRLPNTDKARLKALNTALTRGREMPPFKLAFTQKSFQKLQSFLTSYENALSYYRQSYITQTKKNKDYSASLKKARIYISHFIQVLNLTIIRGELPPVAREYYGLNINESKIPSLNTESDVIKWGDRLIKGESKRVSEGNTPVTNPSIAVVRVRYDIFLEAYHHQKTLKKNTSRTLEQLTTLRSDADEIILQIWNEVEESFKDLPDDLRREKAREYGLVYVYRKNEIDNISFYNILRSGAG